MVGVVGFEPTASWSQTKRANRTAPHPDKIPLQQGDHSRLAFVVAKAEKKAHERRPYLSTLLRYGTLQQAKAE